MTRTISTAIAEQLKLDPALQHIPVVFLTAIVSKDETSATGRTIGGQTFVAKPLNLAALRQCIEAQTGE